MTNIGIVYHSASGTTAQLAQAARDGVHQSPGAQAQVYRIMGEDIVDGRFVNSGLLAELAALDGVIFGSPTYMGGPSAQFKAFADATGELWANRAWADKLAAGFTIGSNLSGDQLNTIAYFQTFASQHGMLWVSLDVPGGHESGVPNRLGAQGGLIAHTRETRVNEQDLATAHYLGQRMATLGAARMRSAAWAAIFSRVSSSCSARSQPGCIHPGCAAPYRRYDRR